MINIIIKVVDQIMGKGKTTTAFSMVNNSQNKNFVYITPYLKEVERVKKECNKKHFNEPKNTGKGKLYNLHNLLRQNRNIASTHALFKMSTEETRSLLSSRNYTLILDEVMDVIEEIQLTEDDVKTLYNENLVYEDNGFLMWNTDKYDYDGTFTRYKLKYQNLIINLMELCKSKSIMIYQDKILMWNFPTNIFNCFDEVYILTYLFEGQIQKYYFDLHNIEYEYYSCNDSMTEFNRIEGVYNYSDIKRHLRESINILEGKINSIGDDDYTLSKSWYYRQYRDNTKLLNEMQKNVINFFTNITDTKTKDNMWTTFKEYKRDIKGKGYTRGFVSCNERATNEYAHKHALAYTINRYMLTMLVNFFSMHNIEVDQDLFALSELVQWIWRSRIRNGESIGIYIPSKRMRGLLIEWLNNDYM